MATDYVEGRNVGMSEGRLTLGVGLGLALAAPWARGTARGALAFAGLALVLRGLAGWCAVYGCLGSSRAGRPTEPRGVHVRERVTIRADAARLYRYWRQLGNLPKLLPHLESVVLLDERRSHWVARGPFGLRVEWDAVTIKDIPNEMLSWQSVSGSDLASAGSVRFVETSAGTEVSVHLQYAPPAGAMGAALAWFFGELPGQELHEGLERLRRELEGELPGEEPSPRRVPSIH